MADMVRPTAVTPLTELRNRAEASGKALLQLATSLDGAVRVRVGADDNAFMIPIEALLLQAIHHGHEHRTQIETMLGQLGIETPGLSGWRYFDEEIGGWWKGMWGKRPLCSVCFRRQKLLCFCRHIGE